MMDQASKARAIIWERSIPEPNTGCWLWLGAVDRKGYGNLTVKDVGKRANRVSYAAFNGPIPDGFWVLHKCDQPSCVNPDHLWVGTYQQNVDDRNKKRRQARGTRNGQSKLTPEQVWVIRNTDRGTCALAREFGVNRSTIHSARYGETWLGLATTKEDGV